MNRQKKMGIGGWVLGLMFLATNAGAWTGGNGVGNGGGAWVCREASGKLRWSQVVDLFEAESEFKLKLSDYRGSVREIVDQVQVRLFKANRSLYEALIPYLEEVSYLEENPPKITHTPDELEIIDDALYRLRPRKALCEGGSIKYEQVVNYKHDGLILVQREIFGSLSDLEKAGLVIHEAVYAYRRAQAGDQNSVLTRRIVGLIFSTLSDQELESALAELGQGEEKEGPLTGMKFVSIPAGSFMMGSPESEKQRDSDEIQHLVTLTRGFEMQTTEVTQAQWVEAMGANRSYFQKPEHCIKTHRVVKGVHLCPNHPVENVTWHKVKEFLSRLNAGRTDGYLYRLPTEAEWEYAARAGAQTAYSFGEDSWNLHQYAWYADNSGKQTQEVAQKKANAFRLYDMHGNVREWVEDEYSVEFGSGPWIDPRIKPGFNGNPWAMSFRVNRGGSWDNGPRYLRSANRGSFSTEVLSKDTGFRLVRTR